MLEQMIHVLPEDSTAGEVYVVTKVNDQKYSKQIIACSYYEIMKMTRDVKLRNHALRESYHFSLS